MLEWLTNFFGGGSGVPDVSAPDSSTAGQYAAGSYGPLVSEPTVPASGGGFGQWLSNFGSGVGDVAQSVLTSKWLDPALKLGMTGMGIVGGIRNMQLGNEQMDVLRDEQRRMAQIAAPAAAAGGALTSAGQAALMGGALPGDLEAFVENWKRETRMKERQRLVDLGMTDSQAAGQIESWIELQAKLLRGQLAEQLLQTGYSGIGTALGPSAAAGQTAGNLVNTAMGGAGNTQRTIWNLIGAS